MEFRVWAILSSEADSRKFMGAVVEKYPVSPQGADNDRPVYNRVGDVDLTVVAFRVTTDNETQDDFLERLYEMEEEDEEYIRYRDQFNVEKLLTNLKTLLSDLCIPWVTLVANSREGECEFSVPQATAKSRFKVIAED